MSWIRKKLGRDSRTDAAPGAPPGPEAASPDEPTTPFDADELARQHHDALDAYWRSVGEVADDVLTYLINPMFQGGPPWPNTRQAYRIVRTAGSLIVASDGLSDPFPADAGRSDRFGFGMETFIEVVGLQDLTVDEIRGHWLFAAIENMAMNVANAGGFVPMLDQHGVLSIELPTDTGPDGWLKPNGMLGALIDLPTGRANVVPDTPLGAVRIVPITIVPPTEIDVCASGASARAALATELAALPTGHRTDPTRPPLR